MHPVAVVVTTKYRKGVNCKMFKIMTFVIGQN